MPDSKYEITEEYITIHLLAAWYCFPFIVLMEDETFMQLVWKRFPDIAVIFKQQPDLAKKRIFFYFTENVTKHDAYEGLSSLILADIDHWKSTLTTCKLY